MAFNDAMAAKVAQMKQQLNDRINDCINQTFTEVVNRNVVLKGAMIDSWYPSIGEDNIDITVGDQVNKTGYESLVRIQYYTSLPDTFLDQDNTINMANNLDYAYGIEFEQKSTQAPEGTARQAVFDVAERINEEERR